MLRPQMVTDVKTIIAPNNDEGYRWYQRLDLQFRFSIASNFRAIKLGEQKSRCSSNTTQHKDDMM